MSKTQLEFEPNYQPIFWHMLAEDVRQCLQRLLPVENSRANNSSQNYLNDDILNMVVSCLFQSRRHDILWIPTGTFANADSSNAKPPNSRPRPSKFFESVSFSGDILECNLPIHDSIFPNGSPRIVLFPINSPDLHWSLAVYYRDAQTHSQQDSNPVIYYYDSIPSSLHPLSHIGVEQERLLNCLLVSYNQPGSMGRTTRSDVSDTEDVCPGFISYTTDSIEIETVNIPAQNENWECGLFVLLVVDMIIQRACAGNYSPLDQNCDFSHLTRNSVLKMRERITNNLLNYSESIQELYKDIFYNFPELKQDNYRSLSKWFGVQKTTDVIRKPTPKGSPKPESISLLGDITYRDFVRFLKCSRFSHKLLTYFCSRSVYTANYSKGPGIKHTVWHHNADSFFSHTTRIASKENMHFLITSSSVHSNSSDTRYVLFIAYCGKFKIYDPGFVLTLELYLNISRRASNYFTISSPDGSANGILNSLRGDSGWVNTHSDSAYVIFLIAEYSSKSGNLLPSAVAENILSLFTQPSFPDEYFQNNLKKYLVSLINSDYVNLRSKSVYFTHSQLDSRDHQSRRRLDSATDSNNGAVSFFIKKPLHTGIIRPYAEEMQYEWDPSNFFQYRLSELLDNSWKATCRSNNDINTSHGSYSILNSHWTVIWGENRDVHKCTLGQLIDLFVPHKEIVNISAYNTRATDSPPKDIPRYWDGLLSSLPRLYLILHNFSGEVLPFREAPRLLLRKGLLSSVHIPRGMSGNGIGYNLSWEECYSKNMDFWKSHSDHMEILLSYHFRDGNNAKIVELLSSIPHVLLDGHSPVGNCLSMGMGHFINNLSRIIGDNTHLSPHFIFGNILILYPVQLSMDHTSCREICGTSTEFVVLSLLKIDLFLDKCSRNGWFTKLLYGHDYPQTLIDHTCYSRSRMLLNLLPRSNIDSKELILLRECINHLQSHQHSPLHFGGIPDCERCGTYKDILSLYGFKRC